MVTVARDVHPAIEEMLISLEIQGLDLEFCIMLAAVVRQSAVSGGGHSLFRLRSEAREFLREAGVSVEWERRFWEMQGGML